MNLSLLLNKNTNTMELGAFGYTPIFIIEKGVLWYKLLK